MMADAGKPVALPPRARHYRAQATEGEVRKLTPNWSTRRRAYRATGGRQQGTRSFSYSVSHDLAGAVVAACAGLRRHVMREAPGPVSDTSRHYLKTIAGRHQEMGVLIDNLLRFPLGRREMS